MLNTEMFGRQLDLKRSGKMKEQLEITVSRIFADVSKLSGSEHC